MQAARRASQIDELLLRFQQRPRSDRLGSANIATGPDDDLDAALKGDFEFKGSYAFGATLPQAPNPCVRIEGVGLIGQPLSDADATKIVSVAAQAPFGQGQNTVVDRTVRDTWEIEAGKVTFANPAWEPYVRATVVATVCNALGVPPASASPRCELYKLLLYQQGSHFLPHQDTEKTPGMFAAIIIVLPSEYAGGQVHVSHAGSEQVFDFASSSLFNTTVLAWYTDVMHEVKPVMSGHRLALSYNVIHTNTSVARPMLPDMDAAVEKLRDIFVKWAAGEYKPKNNTAVCIVDHAYSKLDLNKGLEGLKGKDAHKISHVMKAAEGLGFAICLANLSYHVSGAADDYGCDYGRNKRRRYGYDYRYDDYEDDEKETPPMGEVLETKLELEHIVRLDGERQPPISGSLSVSDKSLVPKSPFKNVKPDSAEYEGYMGNYAGTLDQFYRRTALVIFPEDDIETLKLASGGLDYAVAQLQGSNSTTPASAESKAANFILASVMTRSPHAVVVVARCAINWSDLEMFKNIIKAGGADRKLGILDSTMYGEACKKFSFGRLREIFESLLIHTDSFKLRHEFIQALLHHVRSNENNLLAQWSHIELEKAIQTLKVPTAEDAPSFLSMMSTMGIGSFKNRVIPTLAQFSVGYTFWLPFVQGLHAMKIEAQGAQDGDLVGIIYTCLKILIPLWDAEFSAPYHAYLDHTQQVRVNRFVEVVELCLVTGNRQLCRDLFSQATKVSSQEYSLFYIPLVTSLKQGLLRHQLTLSTSPFAKFIKRLIEAYLVRVLGSNPGGPPIGRFGCGACVDCNALDAFMLSSEPTFRFQRVQAQRTHLESRLFDAQHLVWWSTDKVGSPHTLVIEKSPSILAACQWEGHALQAQQLISAIGDEAVEVIMGVKYGDVLRAIDGSRPYSA